MNLNRFGRPASLARITGLISLGAVASAVPAVLAIKRSLLTALPVAAQTAAATVTCGLVALVAVFARRTGSRAMAVSDVQELTTILAAPPLLGARPSGQGVITSDADGRLDYISAEAQAILGQSTASLAGKTIAEILEPFSTLPTEQGRRMITMVKPDGSTIFIEPIIAPIRDRRGNYVGSVVVLHDLSEVRMLANQLDWQATHDILTGLINRAEFERRIAAGIARSQEFGDPACLCLIDLDQFKIVNDLCGHAAGDKLLREVADLLGRHLRRSDIVARLSGDEFGLLLENCTAAQGLELGQKLLHVIQDWRFHWDDKVFSIGMSMGMVPIDRQLGCIESPLSVAETICYAAKESGRNRIEIYNQNDNVLINRTTEMAWSERISQAIDSNSFVLYQQEYRHLKNGCDHSHRELLIRMIDHDGSLIQPDSFIPAAEHYNLMCRLDQWVIRNAFARFATEGNADKDRWSINLSGQSLSMRETFQHIISEAERHDIRPEAFCFEITETAAIHSLSFSASMVSGLRELGFCFSLDDFGSGLSSFEYLKSLPVDYIKIDGAFVRNLADDPVNIVTVKAITEVAHAMNLKVIAEFAEDERTIRELQALGVDFAQGYGVAKPAPLARRATTLSGSSKP